MSDFLHLYCRRARRFAGRVGFIMHRSLLNPNVDVLAEVPFWCSQG